MERPKSSRAWLITPLVAVVVTLLCAIVLFKVRADQTIWFAACDRRIGCAWPRCSSVPRPWSSAPASRAAVAG
jgi:hypothetical protein